MEKEPISIKKISQLAGVSVATVSRVLNKNGRFSKQTEQRVMDIVRKYNYIPNQVARGLRTSRIKSIGIVVPDVTNEFFSKIILAVQNALFQSEYSAVICNTNEDAKLEKKSIQLLGAQKVSGIIYIRGRDNPNLSLPKDIPTVFIDREPPEQAGKNTLFIESDHFQGGYLAAQEMIFKGCKTIAVMTGKRETSAAKKRLEGCRKACEEQGLSLGPVFYPAAAKFEEAFAELCARLSQGAVFDGILCENDWVALGALRALAVHGRQVPSQVRVCGFDDVSIACVSSIPLTTVRQDTDALGKQAARGILELIRGEVPETRRIVLPVSLLRRAST